MPSGFVRSAVPSYHLDITQGRPHGPTDDVKRAKPGLRRRGPAVRGAADVVEKPSLAMVGTHELDPMAPVEIADLPQMALGVLDGVATETLAHVEARALVADHPGILPEHLRRPAHTRTGQPGVVGELSPPCAEPLTAVLRLILGDAYAPRLASDLADEASSQLAVVAVALRSWGAQRPWELEAVGLPSTSEGLLAWLSQR